MSRRDMALPLVLLWAAVIALAMVSTWVSWACR